MLDRLTEEGLYVYPETNPREAPLTAALDAENLPAIEVDGEFYPHGVELKFDDQWKADPHSATVTITEPSGWTIEGSGWTESDGVATRKVTQAEINQAFSNGGLDLHFTWVGPQKRSFDPKIRITPT
ncbi:hypothetical protein L6R52_15955 [Myxococcota bacterium]|nr:hypothetical protein [Myxococcota bacterium]